MPPEKRAWHVGCIGGGRQLHDPSPEEDDMRILRITGEIAIPVAISLCFAGLSTFAHYATLSLAA